MLQAVAAHAVHRHDSAWRQRDRGGNRLAQEVVGNPVHRNLGNPGQPGDDVLDSARGDFLAACLDDVVLALHEIQETVTIHREQIARAEHLLTMRSDAERFRGRLRSLPVALHDVRSASDQLANASRRHAVTVVVDDERFGSGDGFAD